MQIDEELEESARVFGASFLRALKDIIVPLLAPGAVSYTHLDVYKRQALTSTTLESICGFSA